MRNLPNRWDIQVRHDCFIVATPPFRTDGLRPRSKKNVAVETVAFFFGLRRRKKITGGNTPDWSRISNMPASKSAHSTKGRFRRRCLGLRNRRGGRRFDSNSEAPGCYFGG